MTIARPTTSQPLLVEWLLATSNQSDDDTYRHLLLSEQLHLRAEVIESIKGYVQNAHEDTRMWLRRLSGYETSLDPLEEPVPDPAQGYPGRLHMSVLKGYFGEIMTALIAEQFAPFGEDTWKVPAFLFRFHTVALQQLEMLSQSLTEVRTRPGRTGDDGLAFQLDSDGTISRILYCEAKCTAGHDTAMVAEAHSKVGMALISDILPLIQVLQDRGDAEAFRWIRALQLLRLRLQRVNSPIERYDMVSYICGQRPTRKGRSSWLHPRQPHEAYTGGRRFQAVEIHIADVEALINVIYDRSAHDTDTA